MAEEKEEDFTQKIDQVVSKMLNDKNSNLYLLHKKLFSKQIQDWKSQNHTEQDPSDDNLKQFICKDLQGRYKEAITEIKKKYPSANITNCWENVNCIHIEYEDNNKSIFIEPFFGFYDNENEINIKPKSLRFSEINDSIRASIIKKKYIKTPYETYQIEDCFETTRFNDEDKEKLIKATDLHNVKIEFQEGKICLQSYFNTSSAMVKVNEIEFTLNKGNIIEIKQSYDNGTKQDPPTTITDEKKINNKIKEIFGDKNNTAIQNIINELDNKQRILITNGNPELLNGEDKKNAPPKEEKPKEEDTKKDNTVLNVGAENIELEKRKINDENAIDNHLQPQEQYYKYNFYGCKNNICGSIIDGDGCGCLGCDFG